MGGIAALLAGSGWLLRGRIARGVRARPLPVADERPPSAEALVRASPGSLIVLDEPTVGLHQWDVETLIAALEELRTRKLVSEDEYARAITQLEVAEADERVLDIRLGYMTIRSPIAGVISARLSEPGNVVERHDHVLTISDPSSLVTELPVSELILPRLRVGDRARVRIHALGDQVYEGLITRIYPTLDPVSRRGTIEVELQPVREGVAPGQLCRVELGTHAAQRPVIPFSALRRDEESEYVFVFDADSKAQRVNVKSGLRLAEKIEITEGLEDGQQVITRGFLGLTDGKKVKPVRRSPLTDAG